MFFKLFILTFLGIMNRGFAQTNSPGSFEKYQSYDGYYYAVVQEKSYFSRYTNNKVITALNLNDIQKDKNLVSFCKPSPNSYGWFIDTSTFRGYVTGEVTISGNLFYCVTSVDHQGGPERRLNRLYNANEINQLEDEGQIKKESFLKYGPHLEVGKQVVYKIEGVEGAQIQNLIIDAKIILIYKEGENLRVHFAPVGEASTRIPSLYLKLDKNTPLESFRVNKEIGWLIFAYTYNEGKIKTSLNFPQDLFQPGETVCYKDMNGQISSGLIGALTIGGYQMMSGYFTQQVAKVVDCNSL